MRACVCACARSGPTLHLASQKSLSLPTGVHNNCGDCRKRQLTCPRHSPACCAGVFIQRCVCMLYREALGRVLFCAAKAVGTQECRLKCHLHSLDLTCVRFALKCLLGSCLTRARLACLGAFCLRLALRYQNACAFCLRLALRYGLLTQCRAASSCRTHPRLHHRALTLILTRSARDQRPREWGTSDFE